MPNDVYFEVGLITMIGLSAKNAILIVEVTKDLRAEGKLLLEATIEASQMMPATVLAVFFVPVCPVKYYSLTIPIVDAARAPESTVVDETF